MLPDFKAYYKARVIKMSGTGVKTDIKINRIEESPEIDSTHIWTEITRQLDEGKDSFLTNVARIIGDSLAKE